MYTNITRGLALAAVTGGFLFLGTTGANAATTDDQPGLLDGVNSNSPVDILGWNIGVLDGRYANDSQLLGNGVLVDGGNTASGPVANGTLVNGDDVFVAAPNDTSNTWLSVFGKRANGIVLVPNLAALPTANAEGADADAPVDISCSSIMVLSDFSGDCTSNEPAVTNTDNEGTLTSDAPVGSDGLQVSVLDGALGDDADGVLENGVLLDPSDDTTDLGATPGVGDTVTSDVAAPIDTSDAWVSVLGNSDNGESTGVVIVPDSSVDASALTGGAVDSKTTAPVALSCTSITVLSNYEGDCAGSTTPTDPTDPTDPTTPTTPVVPTGDVPAGDVPDGTNGGDNGGNTTVPCVLAPASSVTGTPSAETAGLIAGAALLGAIGALGMTALGRKLRML